MRSFLRNNSLGVVFGILFLASLVGQAVAGHIAYDENQIEHGGRPISLGRYLTSSSFGEGVMENWQSEYLQFLAFLMLTVWVVQKGSPESKQPGEEGLESDEEQMVGEHAKPGSPGPAKAGGWRAALYGNSLLILMGLIFLLSWYAQSVTGWNMHNEELADHHRHAIGWLGYVGNAQFWENTLQNWQSEFLSVGSFAVFAVYLRQRGSPESKPVGAPHEETAEG
ncbi:MAG TPA: DUF6766 family protein [Solirubrobacterales bacterium]|nr:DUF6766 family protein [Solirubrobacterales bacterium]